MREKKEEIEDRRKNRREKYKREECFDEGKRKEKNRASEGSERNSALLHCESDELVLCVATEKLVKCLTHFPSNCDRAEWLSWLSSRFNTHWSSVRFPQDSTFDVFLFFLL